MNFAVPVDEIIIIFVTILRKFQNFKSKRSKTHTKRLTFLSVKPHKKSCDRGKMPSKCTYPSCEGIFPEANLESCSTTGCEQLLHHVCQGRYEHNMGVELDLHKFCYLCAKREVLTVLRARKGDNDTRNDTGNGSVFLFPDLPPIDSLKILRGGDEDTITETSQQETTSPLPPPFPPQVEQQQIQGGL